MQTDRMPRRAEGAVILLALATLAVATVRAQQVPTIVALTAEWPETVTVEGVEILQVQKNVYMLVGAGAHVTAQIGDEGITLVDSGASGRSTALLAALRRLTRRPVRYLVNTGPDADHIGGNGAIVKASGGPAGPGAGGRGAGNENIGVISVAHENAYNRMFAGTSLMPALTGDALPVSTFFTARKDLYANGEGIEVRHMPAAHTDGDVFVYFRGSDVVSAGEIYNSESYPVIDLARGGSIKGELDALNTLLEMTIPARNQMGGTRVVPAHGRIANEADVLEYRDMLTIIRDRVADLVKKGATLQQVKAARPTLEYDGGYGKNKDWTGEMFLEAVYRDLSRK